MTPGSVTWSLQRSCGLRCVAGAAEQVVSRAYCLFLPREPFLPTTSSAMDFLQDAKWWPSRGTTQVSALGDFTLQVS